MKFYSFIKLFIFLIGHIIDSLIFMKGLIETSKDLTLSEICRGESTFWYESKCYCKNQGCY